VLSCPLYKKKNRHPSLKKLSKNSELKVLNHAILTAADILGQELGGLKGKQSQKSLKKLQIYHPTTSTRTKYK